MLGILCGLQSEAKIARKIPGALVQCCGARPAQARQMATALVRQGATQLLSFGIAGGLAPKLSVGELLVGTCVVSPQGEWGCDKTFRQRLLNRLREAQTGVVFGSESLITTPACKAFLHTRHQADIVDMESHCLAEVAQAEKLPFAVLRSVCDTAGMTLPPTVTATVDPDGSINGLKSVICCLSRPADIPKLIAAGHSTSVALRTLQHAVRLAFA